MLKEKMQVKAPLKDLRVACQSLQAASCILQIHGHSPLGEVFLNLSDRESSEMHDRGDKHRICVSVSNGTVEVFKFSRATGRDDRKGSSVSYWPCHGDVVAGLRTVGVHATGQNLTSAEILNLPCPLSSDILMVEQGVSDPGYGHKIRRNYLRGKRARPDTPYRG